MQYLIDEDLTTEIAIIGRGAIAISSSSARLPATMGTDYMEVGR